MHPSKWIRLNTIACMVIGSAGLIETLIGLALNLMTEHTGHTDTGIRFWDISYPMLRVFYFISAILYLMRRPGGQQWMLLALSATLAHGFLLQILYQSGMDMPGNAVPFYWGLSIHSLILIAVYRFRKEYLMSDEALYALYGAPKTLSAPSLAAISLLGLLLLMVPTILTLLWSRASEAGNTPAERVSIYHAYFPKALAEPYMLTVIGLVSCLLGIVCSSLGSGAKAGVWRILNIPVLILCSLFMLLFLFQMM